MNYIQYIDDTYALKVRPLESEIVDNKVYYSFAPIDTEFFIVAVFIGNKRVDCVEFIDYNNLFQSAFVNDLAMSDLNLIPKNFFSYANQKIKFILSQNSGAFPTTVKSSTLYGHVYPTLKTVLFQPSVQNNHKTLFVKNLGGNPLNRLVVLLYPDGQKVNPENGYQDGSLLQFPALQSFNNYRLLPLGSKVVQVDDVYCSIDMLGNEASQVQFSIQCDIEKNHVNLAFSENYVVKNLESNLNSSTVSKFTIGKLDDDFNDLFDFNLYIDWKKPHLLP